MLTVGRLDGFASAEVRSIPSGPNEATRANPPGPTRKELEVLQLLAQGSSAQLARWLHRSPKTIDHHVCSLFEKLEVHSRAEAVARDLIGESFCCLLDARVRC